MSKFSPIFVQYIDQQLASHKLSPEMVKEMAGAEGIRHFMEFATYRVEEAKLSDLQKQYRKYFRFILKKFGAVSPADLKGKQVADMFNEVTKNWTEGEGPTKKWIEENQYV